jgi:nucleotide-binding universal stress UspA family protein
MALRDLLVHIDDSKPCAARLDAAAKLAEAHAAHLTGLYVTVAPAIGPSMLGLIPSNVLEAKRQLAARRADDAAARFRSAVDRSGIAADYRSVNATDFEVASAIALHARHSDLVVVGQPDPDAPGPGGREFPAVVALACGRPTIVVPYIGTAPTLGERVLIAWDASREATRAANDALPILARAASVTVLVINPETTGESGRREPGADIALHLARHGVKVAVERTVAREITIADAILAAVSDRAVDLLVMGAYGHSRLREVLLGGATRQILDSMTVPVLMSH